MAATRRRRVLRRSLYGCVTDLNMTVCRHFCQARQADRNVGSTSSSRQSRLRKVEPIPSVVPDTFATFDCITSPKYPPHRRTFAQQGAFPMRPNKFDFSSTLNTEVAHATNVQGAFPQRSSYRAQHDSTALAHNEILVEVMYAGMRPGDIQYGQPSMHGVSVQPLIGQETIGRVVAHGRAVSSFAPGDIVGVGAFAASCGQCDRCLAGLAQYCQSGAISTIDYQHAHHPMRSFGKSTTHIVVTEPFAIRIPDNADLAATAPLLGAAVAVYSAMAHWKLEPGQQVGVIGMGGLGHMAVKLAAARRASVTVFTTSPEKKMDALRFGAREAVLWNDEEAFSRLTDRFDVLISTVPQSYSVSDFMALLKLNGTLINLGTTEALQDFPVPNMPRGRRSVAESTGGSVAEMQAVVEYCVAHNIKPEIEVIRPDQLQEISKHAATGRAPYRYVIDLTSERRH
ncbi:NAD(P)-dependent alcohol dehydrogenase [Alcaligenaceae bacterium C4P045]|nr:NAD(P)-dependent alcohol dehydrogenase [Alcaligenaceae bacterium C4P045]